MREGVDLSLMRQNGRDGHGSCQVPGLWIWLAGVCVVCVASGVELGLVMGSSLGDSIVKGISMSNRPCVP